VRYEQRGKTKKSFPFKKTKTGAENDEISKEIFLFWLRRNEVEALVRLGLPRTRGVRCLLKILRARRVKGTLTRNEFEQSAVILHKLKFTDFSTLLLALLKAYTFCLVAPLLSPPPFLFL
jgi:hypothetical protein